MLRPVLTQRVCVLSPVHPASGPRQRPFLDGSPVEPLPACPLTDERSSDAQRRPRAQRDPGCLHGAGVPGTGLRSDGPGAGGGGAPRRAAAGRRAPAAPGPDPPRSAPATGSSPGGSRGWRPCGRPPARRPPRRCLRTDRRATPRRGRPGPAPRGGSPRGGPPLPRRPSEAVPPSGPAVAPEARPAGAGPDGRLPEGGPSLPLVPLAWAVPPVRVERGRSRALAQPVIYAGLHQYGRKMFGFTRRDPLEEFWGLFLADAVTQYFISDPPVGVL